MEGYSCYTHGALQKRATKLIGSWEEDKLFIRLKLFKSIATGSYPYVYRNRKLDQRAFTVKFSHFKQQLFNNCGSDAEYEALISDHLNSMGVPQFVHPDIAERVFRVFEDAVSPVDGVVVGVWDTTYPPAFDSNRPNFVPASASSILALEPMTLDADIITPSPFCAICLDDFDQQEPIIGLPCGHHFHVHCIVQCLEINHPCPLCRYPMPTED